LFRKLLVSSVFLFVLLCSSLIVSVNAALMWSQTYGGAGSESARSLVATSDGGYALAGSSMADFWLVKTDASGNMQWNKTYGGPSTAEVGCSLIVTSDGGYALAGIWNITDYDRSGNQADFWLVKTDASGNMQWNQTYGGTGNDFAYSLVETSDGGYALAGVTSSTGDDGYDASSWLVKTDASGNMQWNQT